MNEYLVTILKAHKIALYRVSAETQLEAAELAISDGELIKEFTNSNVYGIGFAVVPYSTARVVLTYVKTFFGRAYVKPERESVLVQ